MHHNLTSALFLDDLINHFKENNWKLIDADIAFTDSIYNALPNNILAGESLIWAQAKESGIIKINFAIQQRIGDMKKVRWILWGCNLD